jgi:NADH-quinone oxidoreductase subunit A
MDPDVTLSLIVVVALAAAVPAIFFLFGKWSRERSPSREADVAYESGILPNADAQRRFPVRFYLVAVLFVLFDVEGAFVIPWATAFRDLGLMGFVSMALFVGLLLIGLYYLLRRGALEWE